MKKDIRVALVGSLMLACVLISCISAGADTDTTPASEPVAQTETVEAAAVGAVKVVTPQRVGTLPAPETAEPAEPELISLGEYTITHYCACEKCCGKWADGITATGTVATEGRTIAVDPDVIPYGSKVLVRYEDGTEAVYVAEDKGGAIKGNRIDVFMGIHQAALEAGVQTAEVYLLEEVEA